MTRPKRIQRKRTKGWRKPEGAVSVSRPSPWGNPFRVIPKRMRPTPRERAAMLRSGKWCETKAEAVEKFRTYAEIRLEAEPGWLEPLRGKDLMDWCALDEPCHGDVLLELANR